MKKSFPLTSATHKPARVVEGIKADIRKYLKRERRKPLPEETDFWDFDCRSGKDAETAQPIHVSEITKPVDAAAANNWDAVYIEILAKPAKRIAKEKESAESESFQ
jgi:hypothetical protein